MIEHEKTDSGGSVRVKSPQGFATIHFSHFNSEFPLALWCGASSGSSQKISLAVMENLVERYSPVILVVESPQTDLKYLPKVGTLMRCWTHKNQSVFAEGFSSREMFDRVCSLSCAIQNTDFVRVNGSEINLYGYHDILGKIRKTTTPFEFMAIKEQCDHSIKHTSAECVDRIVCAARESLPNVPKNYRERFSVALDEISRRQLKEQGFDTRYSFIQELTTSIVLPAVVKFGSTHPFTQVVLKEFSESAAKYVAVCEEFLNEHGEIDE